MKCCFIFKEVSEVDKKFCADCQGKAGEICAKKKCINFMIKEATM